MKTAQSSLVRIPALMVFAAIFLAAPGVTWGSSNLEDRVERLEKLVEELSPAPENRWSCVAGCWYSIGPNNQWTLMVANGQTSGEAFHKIYYECREISNSYGALIVGFVEMGKAIDTSAATVANSCVRN